MRKTPRELVDQPGEWYVNEATDRLYYYARSGENPQSFTSWIPNQTRILTLDGTSNLTFKGLGLTHVRNSTPNNFGAITYQSTLWVRGAPTKAIAINNSSNISITDGKIVRCGGDGIDVDSTVSNLTINNLIFKDLGDTALNAGRQSYTGAARPDNLTFTNNVVYRVGRSYYSAPGIQVYQSTNSIIDNNHIQGVPYSGISIYNDSGGGSNTKIRNNKIIDTMRVTRDGGAIYTFGPGGTSTGRVTISGNYIKNAFRDPGGIYPDQQSSCVDVTGNALNGVTNWSYINNNANNIATTGNISTTSARTLSGSLGANVVIGTGDPSVQTASAVQGSTIASNAGVGTAYRGATSWVQGVPGGFAANAPNGSGPSVSITGGGTVNLKDNNNTVQANITDDGQPYDGYISALWRQVSGPAGGHASFHHAGNIAGRTRVAFSLPGTYVLACDVSDGFTTSSPQVTYTVTSQSLGTNLALNSTVTSTSNFGGNVAANARTTTPAPSGRRGRATRRTGTCSSTSARLSRSRASKSSPVRPTSATTRATSAGSSASSAPPTTPAAATARSAGSARCPRRSSRRGPPIPSTPRRSATSASARAARTRSSRPRCGSTASAARWPEPRRSQVRCRSLSRPTPSTRRCCQRASAC
jgi:hypothetical protein